MMTPQPTVAAPSPPIGGDRFPDVLALCLERLSAATGCEYAGFVVPKAEGNGCETLAFCHREHLLPNVVLAFNENLLSQSRGWFPNGYRQTAAADPVLSALGIEGFAAHPCPGTAASPAGWLLLLSTVPLVNSELIFAHLTAHTALLPLVLEQSRQLQASQDHRVRLQALLDAVPYPIFCKNHASRYMECNAATARVLGYSREQLLGKTLQEVAPAALVPACNLTEQHILSGAVRADSHEGELHLPDGETREFLFHKAPLIGGAGEIAGVACSFLDITERSRAHAHLEEHRGFLQTIIDSTIDPLMVIGLDQQLLLLNSSARDLAPQLLQASPLHCADVCRAIDAPCRGGLDLCPVQEVLREQKLVKLLQKQRTSAGELVLCEVVAAPLLDEQGTLRGVIHWARDVSERASMLANLDEKEQRLSFLDYHDPLTRLPNRLLFHERLERALSRCRRDAATCSMLFVDLDRFKVVNDSLGHDIGDQVLREIGRLLQSGVRETDTVARFGGDEFLILLEAVEGQAQVLPVVRKLLQLFAKPIVVRELELFVTASIGISFYPQDANDAESMVKNAEVAMYRGKAEGRNTCAFYDRTMDCQAHDQLARELALRQAMECGELQLYYQPQIDLATRRVVGFEGLLRWFHPERGLVGPNEFIPLAEETGLIVPLGEWCIEQVCRFVQRQKTAGMVPATVAVNVSPRQFRQSGFVTMVAEALQRHAVEPGQLELEITEGAIMEDVERSIEQMAALSRMGVRLAIDDFGTGYSSLSYLKKFPIHTLKIDRSFVANISGDSDDAAIVSSIIALAGKMGLKTLAEGVETLDQLVALNRFGCDFAQGFFFSPAVAEEDALQFRRGLAY